MHVAVFADIEGAFGIWRRRQCHTGTAEWQYGRECLTADCNAVIRGAFDGGAHRVTVKDTHATGFNCLTQDLDPRARYRGGHFIRPTFFGPLADYDLVLYVAIHAAAGTPDSFFPHTHYGVFSEVLVNGQPLDEMTLYGAYLGAFDLPIGFVSGEEIAVQQARESLPWVKSVAVDKQQATYCDGARSLRYLQEGRRQLEAQAAAAVRDADQMRPFQLIGALDFAVTFRTEALANKHNTWGFEQQGARVEWRAPDILTAFDAFNKLVFFPRRIYSLRRPLLFTLRRINRLRSRLLAPRANREGAPSPGHD